MPRPQRAAPWLDERDGVFCACWYDAAERRTKRQSLRTRDTAEAHDRFAAFLRGRPEAKPAPDMTAGQTLDLYLEEHVEPKVIDKRRVRDAAKHIRAFLGDAPVSGLGVPLARRYAAKRRSEGAAPATIRKELSTLLTAIRHSIRWGHLAADREPTLERPDAPRSRGLWLTREELRLLRETAAATRDETPDAYRAWAFVELAYLTAGRRRSIETLSWAQVDLDRGKINLAKPNDPETGKRKPIVPIDPALLPTLRLLRERAANDLVLGDAGPIRAAFDALCRRAGLGTLPARDTRPEGRLCRTSCGTAGQRISFRTAPRPGRSRNSSATTFRP